MKFSFVVLLVLCVLCAPPRARSQIDTTLRSFFPMHFGDYWEYMDDDFPTPTLHYYFRVEKDTLMPNGRTYFAFNYGFLDSANSGNGYYFYRIDDSMSVWRYYPDSSTCASSEYIAYRLGSLDRAIWPVCFDIVPGNQQEYIGLYSTQEDFFPHLQLDTLSKLFIGPVVIDSTSGDTLWFSPFFFKDWLAKGLGVARGQGEAGPVVYLIGAIINGRRYGTITSIDESGWGQNAPTQLRLHQNFPNPFNPTTTISFVVPRRGHVKLTVYDILGQHVAMLVDEEKEPGSYSVTLHAQSLSSGVYFYRVEVGGTTVTKRMIVQK